MPISKAETKHEQEIRYYASYYISKQYREIIFSVMQVEFVDQLFEREPVLALDLETPPEIVGLALRAILAESNLKEAVNNPLLKNNLSDILHARIFYTQNDFAKILLLIPDKQTRSGNTFINLPAYQSSRAPTLNNFGRYYLHFRIEATDETIFMRSVFNEWNPIHLSKQVSLNINNEILGALLIGFSRACLSKSA